MLNVLIIIAVEDHFNDKISIHNNCLQTFKDTRFYNLDMADHVLEPNLFERYNTKTTRFIR